MHAFSIQCDLPGSHHDDATALTEINGFTGHFRTSAKMRVGIDTAIEKLVRVVSMHA